MFRLLTLALLISGCAATAPVIEVPIELPPDDPILPSTQTVVTGCEPDFGIVGITTVRGDVGDTVTATIATTTTERLDHFTIDLWLPAQLTLVDIVAGAAVGDFAGFNYSEFPGGVRLGGYGGAAFVPEGVPAELAVMTFTVADPGSTSWSFLHLYDGLETYTPCGEGE